MENQVIGVALGGGFVNAGDPVYVDATGSAVIKMPYKTTLHLSEETMNEIKHALGYLEKPLVKCRHCGQWGAAYCACRHCGAPVDPE